MRRFVCVLFTLFLVSSLAFPVFAAEEDELPGLAVDPTEGLTEQAQALLGDFDASQQRDLGSELLRLLSSALSTISPTIKSGLLSAALILCAVLLCGLLSDGFCSAQAVRLIGTLSIAGACVGGLHSMVSLASDTLSSLNDYSLLLLPGLGTLCTLSGGSALGTSLYTGGILFLDLLMLLGSKLLLPLVWLYAALCVADAALGDGRLGAMRDFLKWLSSCVLKWTVYLFTGYLGVTGVLSGSVDAIRLRTTRVALSGAVPVVGGILSEASETLLSAAGALKNSVGVFGLLAVLALCLSPFLQLGAQFLILKGTAAVSGLLGQPELTGLTEKLSDALGLLLGMTGAYALAALLCIVFAMKAVGL